MGANGGQTSRQTLARGKSRTFNATSILACHNFASVTREQRWSRALRHDIRRRLLGVRRDLSNRHHAGGLTLNGDVPVCSQSMHPSEPLSFKLSDKLSTLPFLFGSHRHRIESHKASRDFLRQGILRKL